MYLEVVESGEPELAFSSLDACSSEEALDADFSVVNIAQAVAQHLVADSGSSGMK